MKIQLITAVAVLWRCRERSPDVLVLPSYKSDFEMNSNETQHELRPLKLPVGCLCLLRSTRSGARMQGSSYWAVQS